MKKTPARVEVSEPEAVATPCPHLGLRAVLFDEELNTQERARRPYTCDDCNKLLGPLGSRFTRDQVILLFIQERRERANGRR
jgi:hypothetical protein